MTLGQEQINIIVGIPLYLGIVCAIVFATGIVLYLFAKKRGRKA